MSISPFGTPSPEKITPTISLEPTYNILMSMALLTSDTLDPEREPWLASTAARLTAEQRQTNLLIFEGLGQALLPTKQYADFLSHVHALSAQSPEALRDSVGTESNPLLDAALHADLDQLLADPLAMQQRITTHLRMLWQTFFKEIWTEKQQVMHFIASEISSRTWPTDSASAIVRAFIRRPIPDWISAQLGSVEEVILVPSPTIQLHVARFGDPTKVWLFMHADPWTWPTRTEPIKRGEVLNPVNALADDTRLRILELLAAHEQLLAQEIIGHLDTTQSTVSRHLKQLLNARFITEKRAEGANKVYRLNRERVGEVAYSLSQLLSAENAKMVLNDVRLEQPEALRPFLNRDGLLISWSTKSKGREAILAYLISKFASDERYTEAEVNERLNRWHRYNNAGDIYQDAAHLRRELIDAGLLKRTRDGAEYWRAE